MGYTRSLFVGGNADIADIGAVHVAPVDIVAVGTEAADFDVVGDVVIGTVVGIPKMLKAGSAHSAVRCYVQRIARCYSISLQNFSSVGVCTTTIYIPRSSTFPPLLVSKPSGALQVGQ